LGTALRMPPRFSYNPKVLQGKVSPGRNAGASELHHTGLEFERGESE
jgi:hypothetical protein